MPRRILDGIGDAPSTTRKYDWVEALDGCKRVYIRGIDFTCKPNSFQVAAHLAANRHNDKTGESIFVKTEWPSDDKVIIQAFTE